jgi:hypothetical protein
LVPTIICVPVTILTSCPSMHQIREIAVGVDSPGSPPQFRRFVICTCSAAGKVVTESRVPPGKEIKLIKSGNEIYEQT